MNSMAILKSAIIGRNRAVANVILRRLGVDIQGILSEEALESDNSGDLVLLELKTGDRFWYKTSNECAETEHDGLPVFCRRDLMQLRSLL